MSEVRIPTEPRTEFGKGAARRLRRNDQVPAVLYGHGTDPVHVALPAHDLGRALKTSGVLLELQLASGPQLALPKSVQRDPIKHTIEHIDLVVMATHGRTGLKHVLMGSVAEKVARMSTAPVLTVKPRAVREYIIAAEDVEHDLHIR